MSVWIVEEYGLYYDGGNETVKVFADEDSAEDWVKDQDGNGDSYEINEWEVETYTKFEEYVTVDISRGMAIIHHENGSTTERPLHPAFVA